MDSTYASTQYQEVREYALAVGQKMADLKARDVVALDVSNLSSFADFFILGTLNSFGQLKGVSGEVLQLLTDLGVAHKGGKHLDQDDPWVIIDCGSFIIHLMSEKAREFYNLEKMWSEAEITHFD